MTPAPSIAPILVTDRVAAWALGIGPSTFRAYVRKGELPAPVETPLGRRWRWADLVEYAARLVTTDIAARLDGRGGRRRKRGNAA